MLLLEQPSPQIVACMRAPCQGTQPGAVRGLDIGELLQSLEYERINFAADDQIESRQRSGGE